nr:hypothetical protein [uncultured Prevotella sp.]
MVNYSLVSRSVNANLLEINLAKARIKAVKEGKESVITCYILSTHPSPSCPMA